MRFVNMDKMGAFILFMYDRFNNLVKMTGVSKAHLNRLLGKTSYYLRDAQKSNIDIPYESVVILAEALGTTPEYLRGETNEQKTKKPAAQGDGLSEKEMNVIRLMRQVPVGDREMVYVLLEDLLQTLLRRSDNAEGK